MSNKFYTAAGLTLTVNGSNIANVTVLTIDPPTINQQDVTNFGSPKVGGIIYQEQVPSKLNAGKFQGEAYYIPNDPGLLALKAAFANTALSTFTLTLPMDESGNTQTTSGDVYSWTGYVTTQPAATISGPDKVLTYKIDASMLSTLTVTSGS